MRITAKKLAERLDVEYGVAAALIKLMVAQGVGKEVGKEPSISSTGRGKPSTIYELPSEYTINLMPREAQVQTPAA